MIERYNQQYQSNLTKGAEKIEVQTYDWNKEDQGKLSKGIERIDVKTNDYEWNKPSF